MASPLLHVPCSRCNAQVGEPCTVLGTNLVTRSATPHAARRHADEMFWTMVTMDGQTRLRAGDES